MLSLTLSALAHGAVLAGLWALAGVWGQPSKVYVVNLVPSIAAVGSPRSRPALLSPSPARTSAAQEPSRPAREPVTKEPPALPASPDLSRIEPRLPSRLPALPRPGEKEPTPLLPARERRPAPTPILARTEPAPAPSRAEPVAESRTGSPSVPPGLPQGSPAGTASLSLDVSDFPHAWYLRQILQKVEESWTRQAKVASPEQKPLVYVEIQRDGSIVPPKIERSSGNTIYDQATLRAIIEASPFPPLPSEWPKPSLRILFRFELRPERG